jgi:hypothetical protein
MISISTVPDRSKKADASKSGSGSDQIGFGIVEKRSDPEHTMLWSWSRNEEFHFPCYGCIFFLLELLLDPHQKAMYTLRYTFAKTF